MTATTEAPPRIVTLDIVRGVAVMGILAMNIIAFAMPFQAYMNPAAFGTEDGLDFLSWLFSFVFVDGKMRGLFSFLFGASMLLVIERAAAKGESPAGVHFRRMAWLLVFGLLHLYLIWFGDILALYAIVGMVAWLFRNKSARSLIRIGIGLLVLQLFIYGLMSFGAYTLSQAAADPNTPPDLLAQWRELEGKFGIITGQPLAEKIGMFRGDWLGQVEWRLDRHAFGPFASLLILGAETLAYFLFGMAAFRTGFLTGDWADGRYRKWLVTGLAIAVPAYLLLAWLLVQANYSVPAVMGFVMTATVPFRPFLIVAYAALIILATRGGGRLVERIAAAGRAAFTNYLGTSLVMTGIFYGWGLGLYGRLDRAELWLVVCAMWAIMLIWSKPWLDRFAYGPFEWAWRSLSRGKVQPMRRTARIVEAKA